MVDFISSRATEGLFTPSLESAGPLYDQTPSSASLLRKGLAAFDVAPFGLGPLGRVGTAAQAVPYDPNAGLFERGFEAAWEGGGVAFKPPPPQQPPEDLGPMLQPEEYNKRFAAPGMSIGTSPLPEKIAQNIGDSQRRLVESKTILAHTGIWGTLGAQALGSVMDPFSLAVGMIPGIGEGAILSRLGIGTGFVARSLARLAAGAVTGAAFQVPFSGLGLALALDPAAQSDYSLRDALFDIAYSGPKQIALMHLGFGALRDAANFARGRSPMVEAAMRLPMTPEDLQALSPEQRVRLQQSQILAAHPDMMRAALQASMAQLMDGRPVDVEPFFPARRPAETPMTAVGHFMETLDQQRKLWQTGFAGGVAQPEFDRIGQQLFAAEHPTPAAERPGAAPVSRETPGVVPGAIPVHRVISGEGPPAERLAERPNGLYVSIVEHPETFTSPHVDETTTHGQSGYLTPRAPLVVSGNEMVSHARFGPIKEAPASAGIAALKQLSKAEEFNSLMSMSKPQVIAQIEKEFPGLDITRRAASKDYDAYDMLEILGAQRAKAAGHDAIIARDPVTPNLSEAVVLDPSAVKFAPPTTEEIAKFAPAVVEGAVPPTPLSGLDTETQRSLEEAERQFAPVMSEATADPVIRQEIEATRLAMERAEQKAKSGAFETAANCLMRAGA